jgi:low affinity Fe/Cu permease
VASSCGCTTPKWSRDPIKPGESAEIMAEYSTVGRLGPFSKNLSVYILGGTSVITLTLKGIVVLQE